MDDLRPFQRRFLSNALRPDIDLAILSIPRGNGKSSLSGYLLSRVLSPDDDLFQKGTESILLAGSIEQARIVYKFARDILEPRGGYSFTDSHTRIGIRHKDTNTRLRVISSSAKTAMGIVGCPVLVGDECGSWETLGGEMMFDAITTAQGKPGSPLKVILISTIAPADRGWWPELVERGSHGSTYVQKLVGDAERWDNWREIKRVNPLTAISPEFRKKLREERAEARRDSRLKARWLSFRMNRPTADEASVLLTTADWQIALARPVPERKGKPVTAIDMGGGLSVALWDGSDGTSKREALRQAVTTAYLPLGRLISTELSAKLGVDISLSFTDLWGHDAVGRSQALKNMIVAGVPLEKALGLSGIMGLEE